MLRPIYLLFFKIFGWKVTGHFPKEIKKFIIAVAPHTSNWDFVVGIAARSILGIQRAKFLGKSQLFKAPYGWFFKLLGGYPVDRSQSNDVTDQTAEIFNTHDRFILEVAPEGTRKKVSHSSWVRLFEERSNRWQSTLSKGNKCGYGRASEFL
jgi:1-acyl-sn-glycerol-3-phosphate acyltransferase